MAEVLLINPPARTLQKEAIIVPPLGLAYLAAAGRQAGHKVSILDAFAEGLSWEEFERRVSLKKHDIIGFSGMTPVIDTVRRAIRVCRPHADALILGGPHATAFRDTVLRDNPDLDYAFLGEGEAAFVEFLEAFEGNGVTADIAGILTRDGDGPPREPCRDLDALPFPARDLLPNDRYRYPLTTATRVTSMVTSRGCPYKCVFCDKSIFGSKWRARGAQSVLEEIDEVVGQYGVQTIIFYDDLFTLKRDRLTEICEGLIERNYGINWKAEGRVDLADAHVLQLMRRAGCDTIAYGVETVNPHGLEFLRKKTDPQAAREAFRLTRAAGIKTIGYFILGIPVETYDEALATIRFAIELKTDYAQFSILSPLAGSDLYKIAREEGWYAEVAAHNVSDKDLLRPVVLSPNWNEESLRAIVRQAHRMFYMRPSYMLKSLGRVRNLRETRNLVGLGWDMGRYLLSPRRRGG